MYKIDRRVNLELHTSILQEDSIVTLWFYGLDRADIIFKQDDGPKHTFCESVLCSLYFCIPPSNTLSFATQSMLIHMSEFHIPLARAI